jgi:hypothetical protein
MSISGLGSLPAGIQGLNSRISRDFTDLGSSLQSNNISGAQQAYADIVRVTHGAAAAGGAGLGPDFARLGTALRSGNLSNAQAAYARFQADSGVAAPASSGGGLFHSLLQAGLKLLK